MGAQTFINEKKASSPRQAFEELVEQAIYDYGHDAYNGTISTCGLGRERRPLDIKPNFCKENINVAYKYIQDHDYGKKWVADYIDLGKTEDGEHYYMFYGWASC